MKQVKLPIILSPWQETVDRCGKRFVILRCGRKSGKTEYAIYKVIKGLSQRDAYVQYIAPTTAQAKDVAWRRIKAMIPQKMLAKKPNETDLTIELVNGSRAHLLGSENAVSIRGTNPTGVVMEESSFHKPDVYEEIVSPNLTAKQAWLLQIFTPCGMNWQWDLEQRAKENPNWGIFHYTFYDNPYINETERQRAREDCKSDIVWRQEYLAEYEAQAGRVFEEFDERIHVSQVDVPSPGQSVYRGVDWGMRDPTVCVWGRIESGKLKVYDLYSKNNLPASIQARAIRNQTGLAQCLGTALSHDAFKQDPEMKGMTVALTFSKEGIRPLQQSSRNKMGGLDLIKMMFKEGKILIDKKRCRPLITQLLSYEWKDTAFEKTSDGNDDCVDALRYLVQLVEPVMRRLGISIENKKETRAEFQKRIDEANEKVQRLKGFRDDEAGVEAELAEWFK